MNALKLLRQDHDDLRKLFDEIDATRRASRARERLYQALCEELVLHAQAEEEVLYPALKATSSIELRRLALEAVEGHRLIDDLLEDLADLGPADEEFDAKMSVLRDNVLHHVDELEGAMFDEADKVLEKEQLERLGRALADPKEALKAQPAHR